MQAGEYASMLIGGGMWLKVCPRTLAVVIAIMGG
jgi:hypothetical protein